ncbi:hypothetical protein BKA93DRAFT_729915 [Sparassis latifolia]
MSKTIEEKKNVVIVGGGHAGSLLARSLSRTLDSSKYRVILINERPYAIHFLAAARMTVTDEGHIEDGALIPYDKLFINGNGTLKVDKVTAIEETEPGQGGVVVLQSGERISYAALALASGSSWSGPLDFPTTDSEIREHIKEWRLKYGNAKHIVLIGGGAVGIETAGELRDTFADKKITIIQSDKMLLNATYPAKYRKDLEKRVRARKINLVLGEYLDSMPELDTIGITTRSGTTIPDADLVVPTFGPRLNVAYIKTLGSDVLNERSQVKVKPTFETVAHPGVFALGDITDWKEQKQALKGPAHVAVVAPNITSFLAGEPQKKIYKGTPEAIVVPIGKGHGSSYFPYFWGLMFGDYFTSWLKGGDLFIKKTRAERGL